MPFDLGDTVPLAAEAVDPGGNPVNPTGATLTITLPDGTTVTPTVTNPPTTTGQYSVDYVTEQPGRHAVRWVFTVPNSAYTDVFDVREEVPPLIVSLADAKKHLNLTSSRSDEEVRAWLESITEGVENLAGVCVRRTFSERHDTPGCGFPQLVLHRTPVLALVSVRGILSLGRTYDVAGLDVDGETGIVQRLDGHRLYGPLRVTYTAGRQVIPASIRDAAKIILKHLWRTQYGASRALGDVGGTDDYSVTEAVPGFGYAIPNRALQLLEPYRLPPAVA